MEFETLILPSDLGPDLFDATVYYNGYMVSEHVGFTADAVSGVAEAAAWMASLPSALA